MRDDEREAFEALAGDLCAAHGLDKRSVAVRGETLGVVTYSMLADGAEVALVHASGQPHFNALIDAGPAPSLTQREPWKALMELNFSMVSSRYDACFCCDESMSRLQLRMVFRLGNVDAPQLAEALSRAVKSVRIWQEAAGEALLPPSADHPATKGAAQ